MQFLKQSTAATVTVGPILDSAGAEYTSAVIGDLSIRKQDGSVAAMASAATLTHSANGVYTLVMTTGNTDTLGRLDIHCNKSTYQMPPLKYDVIPAMRYDSLILGSDRFDVNVTHVGDTSQTARDIGASVLLSSGTGTGQVTLTSGRVNADLTHIATAAVSTTTAQLGVNIVQLSGDATAADNAESFFDGTGYAGTNNVIPTVTTVGTLTTYTGNTPQTGDSFARIGATGSGLTSLAPSATALSTATWTGTRAGYLDNLSAGAVATASALTSAAADITTILIKFTGITLLAQWLGLIAGKQTGNTTARTELRATGAGSGTYDETTDSLEANRDNIGTAGAGLTAADDAVITAVGALNNLSAAQVNAEVDTALADVGLTTTVTGRIDAAVSTRASQASVDDLPTNAELATSQAAADDATLAAIAALSIPTVSQILTTQMTESYAADGTAPTLAQALFLIQQQLGDFAISGTVLTVKKLDGTTTAATFTLSDATNPTSLTRAS
jgi:hypothetical protein